MKQIIALTATLLAAGTVFAAPITPGDLIIYRVGDGSAALGATATAIFLDEYTPLGGFVQSIALPTTGGTVITAVGNSTTEGIMSLSQNGSKLLFAGYRIDAGTSSPGAATVNRVIGTFSPSTGLFDTSLSITDAGTGVPRSVTSTDGSSLFYMGTSAGVRYIGTPGAAGTSTLIDSRNSRQVLLSGDKLFASNGSSGLTPKVQDYGTLPTGPVVSNSVVVLATGDAVNGFAFFDLNPSVAGNDTLYALSTVEGLLRKYTFDGSLWSASGSIASSAADVTGLASGGSVSLWLTSGSTLSGLTDSSGYGGTLSGTTTSLATSTANTAFRGLVVYVPEPSAFALIGMGLTGLIFFRRR